MEKVLIDNETMKRTLRRLSYEIIEKNSDLNNVVLLGIRKKGVAVSTIIATNIERIEGVKIAHYDLDFTPYRDDIKTEILIALRYSDLISISDRGVTTSTDSGTFTTDLTYTLGTNPTLLKNIRSLIIDAVTLKLGKDYTVNYETGVITFLVAQSGAYTIIYDQGTTDRIYPDYPQPYLKLKDFPRIGFDIISGNSSEFGIGAEVTQSDYLISITWDRKSVV